LGEEFADTDGAAPGDEDSEDKEDEDEIPGHHGMKAFLDDPEQVGWPIGGERSQLGFFAALRMTT